MNALPNPDFWRDRRVLVTGHTGFKGSWLVLLLKRFGAQVTAVSLPPDTEPNLFYAASIEQLCDSHFADLRDRAALGRIAEQAQPQVVFHLAAQALVRRAYRDPLSTWSSNVMGTANLLDAMRTVAPLQAVVAITTDKVYANREWVWPYREDDPLGGHDPYSASKAACELVVDSFRKSFFEAQGVALATARAGNVIGGGDWSEDRLLPDAVRSWTQGSPLQIRRPDAVRPWQHVVEPLMAYLTLAAALVRQPGLADAYNFGPSTDQAASVRQVILHARSVFGQGEVQFANQVDGPHEAGLLTLDASRAKASLGISPKWSLHESIERTMQWYRAFGQGASARNLCEADVDAYLQAT